MAEATATEETTTEETATEETAQEQITEEQTASDFNWRQGLSDPDQIKQAERYASNADVVQATIDMRKKLGSSVNIPNEKSDDTEWITYRKNMGIPDTPEEYKYEGLTVDDKMSQEQKAGLEKWNKIFHDENISIKGAQRLMNEFRTDMGAQLESQMEADKKYSAETDANLRSLWGTDYDKNKEYANRAATDLFGEDFESAKGIEMKDGRFLLDNPLISKVFATVGREMGEGRLGDVLSDNEVETLEESADSYRDKKRIALAEGNNKEASKWDKKEFEILKRLDANRMKGQV